MKSYQKQIIYWDTSLNITEFPETVKKIFNKLYFKERQKFTLWLDRISQKHFMYRTFVSLQEVLYML